MSGGSLNYGFAKINMVLDDIWEQYAEIVTGLKDSKYKKQIIQEISKTNQCLKEASIRSKRLEWLISGDDGEETYLSRLKEDLDNINQIFDYG